MTLPIVDGPVQVSVTEQLEKFVNYLFYFTGGKLTLKQAKSGSLLIGGGWPAHVDKNGVASLSPESLRSNLGVALKVVPALSSVKVIRTLDRGGKRNTGSSTDIGPDSWDTRCIFWTLPRNGIFRRTANGAHSCRIGSHGSEPAETYRNLHWIDSSNDMEETKNVLITGAAQGIGAGIAWAYGQRAIT